MGSNRHGGVVSYRPYATSGLELFGNTFFSGTLSAEQSSERAIARHTATAPARTFEIRFPCRAAQEVSTRVG